MVVRVADELDDDVRRPRGPRHRRRLRAPPRRTCPPPSDGPADRRVPRRHDRQLHAGRAAALPALARAAAAARDRPPAARHRPRQGPARSSRPPTTTRGRHRGVQPQRPARAQPRARRRLRRRRLRARRVLRPPSTSGSRCGCARAARMAVTVGALDLQVEFAAGEELRTEISAKFTPERLAGDLAAAGLALEQLLTDDDGLFALSLSTPTRLGASARRSSPRPGPGRRTSSRCRSGRPSSRGR